MSALDRLTVSHPTPAGPCTTTLLLDPLGRTGTMRCPCLRVVIRVAVALTPDERAQREEEWLMLRMAEDHLRQAQEWARRARDLRAWLNEHLPS